MDPFQILSWRPKTHIFVRVGVNRLRSYSGQKAFSAAKIFWDDILFMMKKIYKISVFFRLWIFGTRFKGQRLIFQGRMLNDEITLSTAGINDNAVLHCVERAPPQPSNSSSTQTPEENSRSRAQNRNRIR